MDGKDQKDWINTRLPLKATVSAQAQISLTLESHQIKANISPVAGGHTRLAAYWP